MEEQNSEAIQKLCFLIRKRNKAELDFSRASYRVSYYRKKLLKLDKDFSKKAAHERLEIAKKIEIERLNCLKKQQQLLQLRAKLNGPINKTRLIANAKPVSDTTGIIKKIFIWSNGYLTELISTLDAAQIEEQADQYEANLALNKILKKEYTAT